MLLEVDDRGGGRIADDIARPSNAITEIGVLEVEEDMRIEATDLRQHMTRNKQMASRERSNIPWRAVIPVPKLLTAHAAASQAEICEYIAGE